MSRIVLAIFTVLTVGSLLMTYDSRTLEGVKSHSSTKQLRSARVGSWIGSSSGGGFSSGK